MPAPPDQGRKVETDGVGGVVVVSAAEVGSIDFALDPGFPPDSMELSLGPVAVVHRDLWAAVRMLGMDFGSGSFDPVARADLPTDCRCGCWTPWLLVRGGVVEDKQVRELEKSELCVRESGYMLCRL